MSAVQVTQDQRTHVCPECNKKGKPVKTETLRWLIKSEAQDRVSEGPYRFCDAQDCGVVYFAEDGSHVFQKANLIVRVGVKETEPPRPVCYCFHHTVEEIFAEIRETGQSTVLEDIKTRINTEGCRCEHTNPQGSCCLGVVTLFVREGMRRFAGRGAVAETADENCCSPAPEAADCCGPAPEAADCCGPQAKRETKPVGTDARKQGCCG